jgi:hypothetical protein
MMLLLPTEAGALPSTLAPADTTGPVLFGRTGHLLGDRIPCLDRGTTEELLGHDNIATTPDYLHARPDSLSGLRLDAGILRRSSTRRPAQCLTKQRILRMCRTRWTQRHAIADTLATRMTLQKTAPETANRRLFGPAVRAYASQVQTIQQVQVRCSPNCGAGLSSDHGPRAEGTVRAILAFAVACVMRRMFRALSWDLEPVAKSWVRCPMRDPALAHLSGVEQIRAKLPPIVLMCQRRRPFCRRPASLCSSPAASTSPIRRRPPSCAHAVRTEPTRWLIGKVAPLTALMPSSRRRSPPGGCRD